MKVPTWRAIEPWERQSCLMTRAEFIEGVRHKVFTNYDGYGVLATDKVLCENTNAFSVCYDDVPDLFTHIVWYNR